MRKLLALLLVASVLVPGAFAEETTVEDEIQPLDHGTDDHQDSPGLGIVALVGLLGSVALLGRRS